MKKTRCGSWSRREQKELQFSNVHYGAFIFLNFAKPLLGFGFFVCLLGWEFFVGFGLDFCFIFPWSWDFWREGFDNLYLAVFLPWTMISRKCKSPANERLPWPLLLGETEGSTTQIIHFLYTEIHFLCFLCLSQIIHFPCFT